MKCKHEWRWLYKFHDKEALVDLYYKNYDVFYCVHCLKQAYRERECPNQMKN